MRTHSTRQRVERTATERLHFHIRARLCHAPLIVIAAAIEEADSIFAEGAGSMDVALRAGLALADRLRAQREAA